MLCAGTSNICTVVVTSAYPRCSALCPGRRQQQHASIPTGVCRHRIAQCQQHCWRYILCSGSRHRIAHHEQLIGSGNSVRSGPARLADQIQYVVFTHANRSSACPVAGTNASIIGCDCRQHDLPGCQCSAPLSHVAAHDRPISGRVTVSLAGQSVTCTVLAKEIQPHE